MLGDLLRISCHHQLGKMFTWGTSILGDHKVDTTGPYQIMRHPGYISFAIVVVGYACFLYTPGTL